MILVRSGKIVQRLDLHKRQTASSSGFSLNMKSARSRKLFSGLISPSQTCQDRERLALSRSSLSCDGAGRPTTWAELCLFELVGLRAANEELIVSPTACSTVNQRGKQSLVNAHRGDASPAPLAFLLFGGAGEAGITDDIAVSAWVGPASNAAIAPGMLFKS